MLKEIYWVFVMVISLVSVMVIRLGLVMGIARDLQMD